MGKVTLFAESSDDEEKEKPLFRTNKSYAKHYDEYRKKEILGQLKNLKAADESSSSDDETTDEEIVDPEFDKEFFRTLAFLKRRDPSKYSEGTKFFENVKPVEEVALERKRKKEKPMRLKDYERNILLEKGGIFEDEDDGTPVDMRPGSPSVVQQQEQIRSEIKQALSKIGESDDDDEDGGLLKERGKTKEENEKEQHDYLYWLADKKAKAPLREDVKPLQPLKEFWNSGKLSKEDAFLKDYILNRRFVQQGDDMPTYDDIVATSEDEEEFDKQEEFVRKYNFRFEEPDADYLKRFPRVVEDSVRVERNKRKEQRQALKERKQQEKDQQRQELEQLKAIKLQEIRDKIQKLKDIAATEELAIGEHDLEAEFDPDEHDQRMEKMFNNEYYGVDEGDQKPVFPELDEELGIENYDKDKIDSDNDYDAPHCEDDDFVMDCDYEDANQQRLNAKESLQQELLKATRSKKKGKRVSRFREMLKTERPLFDPEDERTYGEYIDEYYKLDYEDMIGDTPCRFRYVETVPNDFGLSIEEILMANTRDLNRWASVKKTVQLRPKQAELNEVNYYKNKAQNEAIKRKILPSLYENHDNEGELDAEIVQQKQLTQAASVASKTEATEGGKKSKKKKTKPPSNTEEEMEPTATEFVDESPKKSEKRRKATKTNPTVPNGVEPSSAEHRASEASGRPSKKSDKRRKTTEIIPTVSNGVGSSTMEQHVPVKDAGAHGKKRKHRHDANAQSQQSKRQKIDRKPHGSKDHQQASTVSDDRLRAFGINPRKYHNKQKYGGKNQQNNNGHRDGGKAHGKHVNNSKRGKGQKS